MAEAIAVVGVVSSIVQLVDFSSKILHRLDELQSTAQELPRIFQHTKAELPLLRDTLQETSEALNAGRILEKTGKALVPIIEGCEEQIKVLNVILAKVLPTAGDSWVKKGRKAI